MVVDIMKSDKHIEIVRSTTKSLSSLSQVSCDAIFEVLARHFTSVGVSVVNDPAGLKSVVDSQPDLVFLGMEYITTGQGKIWLGEFLDEHRIAYTGSNKSAHLLGRSKPEAKQKIQRANLSTADFCVVSQWQVLDEADFALNYPVFVKPSNGGGGYGVDSDSVVYNFDQLRRKVEIVTKVLRADALIETYLPGREFSVAILKNKYDDDYLVMPIELIAPADKNGERMLSGRVKHADAEIALAITDEVLKSQINELALASFVALGARDYGRIDIRLSLDGTPHFLEANLIPCLIRNYGSFPKACVINTGLEYEAMILQIVALGLTRVNFVAEALPEPVVIIDPLLQPIG